MFLVLGGDAGLEVRDLVLGLEEFLELMLVEELLLEGEAVVVW